MLDDSTGFAPCTSFLEFNGALKPSCYNISEKANVLYNLPLIAKRVDTTAELVRQLVTGNCNTPRLMNLWLYNVCTSPGRLTPSNLSVRGEQFQ